MVIDWLVVGVNSGLFIMFIQFQVFEYVELYLLLLMIMLFGWLECVFIFKDQQEKLWEKDLVIYGFLGYLLFQSVDIFVYCVGKVLVGVDQVFYVEIICEIVCCFNYIYGWELGFEEQVEGVIVKMGKKNVKFYWNLKKCYQEEGDMEVLEMVCVLFKEQQNIFLGDCECFYGYIEGGGKVILLEFQLLLMLEFKMLGLDGQKMFKFYNNYIGLWEELDSVVQKICIM